MYKVLLQRLVEAAVAKSRRDHCPPQLLGGGFYFPAALAWHMH